METIMIPHHLERSRRSASALLDRLRLVAAIVAIGLLASACDISWLTAPFDDEAQQAVAPSPTATHASAIATPRPTATMLPMPFSTPAVHATATPKATATPSPTPQPTLTPTPVRVTGLAALLPTVEDLPNDFQLDSEDADLTAAEVAAEADNAPDYVAKLSEWDYRGGASRQFSLPDPGFSEFISKLLGLQATVLEFGSAEQAQQALAFQYAYAQQRPGWDLHTTDVEALGDSSMALTGSADYQGTTVRAAVIFVQQGARLYRFVGISGATDHFDTTVDIAKQTIAP